MNAPLHNPHAPEDIAFALELNGQPVQVTCPPDTRLLTLLREHWQLTGAKPGCEVGRCGACMVWLNDAPANACLLMAWQLQGQRVRTIESLATSPECAPVQQALATCGGVQCGYCTSGMLMNMTWLHQQQPRPSADEAIELMSGNLCRCTGYGGIRRAVEQLFGGDQSYSA
ncbi:(2Fe-2S)-binding protein [Diaphorobacter sp. HDW4A]|uniref:(2Fe-2S)-binding protein n=1 Tax=Diaphorobacter sp. HDW4A TaxID=2714924 RepID=UPI001408C8CC|nr:(2Fe-2S)-binding protein [Diaphorobacter sp. HDW4A]QIL79921.1 (2Fe-2S)-binding protein [Diaphorobacter sp. HDW4A]